MSPGTNTDTDTNIISEMPSDSAVNFPPSKMSAANPMHEMGGNEAHPPPVVHELE